MNRLKEPEQEPEQNVSGGAVTPAAFEAAIRPFYERIYRWAFVITGSCDDADDVRQEVLIRAWRHLGGFRGEAGLTTWLYRMTRNAALEFMARSARRRETASSRIDWLSAEPAAGRSPGGDIDRRQLVELIPCFLAELSVRQREVFDLVDLQGYEPVEAAGMLGLDNATARTHLHRARRAIRRRILDRGPEWEDPTGGRGRRKERA